MSTVKKAQTRERLEVLTSIVLYRAPERNANTDLTPLHLEDRWEDHKFKASIGYKVTARLWKRRKKKEREGKEFRTGFGFLLKAIYELALYSAPRVNSYNPEGCLEQSGEGDMPLLMCPLAQRQHCNPRRSPRFVHSVLASSTAVFFMVLRRLLQSQNWHPEGGHHQAE